MSGDGGLPSVAQEDWKTNVATQASRGEEMLSGPQREEESGTGVEGQRESNGLVPRLGPRVPVTCQLL